MIQTASVGRLTEAEARGTAAVEATRELLRTARSAMARAMVRAMVGEGTAREETAREETAREETAGEGKARRTATAEKTAR